jgi:hypothetical protein
MIIAALGFVLAFIVHLALVMIVALVLYTIFTIVVKTVCVFIVMYLKRKNRIQIRLLEAGN